MRRQLATRGAWILAGKAGGAVLALISNALLARILSPGELGSYFLFLSLVTVAAVIAQLGLNQAIVRTVAESRAINLPGRARQSIRLSFVAVLVASLTVAIILSTGVDVWIARDVFASEQLVKSVWLLGPFVVWGSIHNLIVESLRGFNDIRGAALFGEVVVAAFSSLLFFVMWWVRGEAALHTILTLSLLAGATASLIAALLLRNRIAALGELGSVKLGELAHLALPLYLVGLSSFGAAQFDLWIIGAYRPAGEVALYGAASRLLILVIIPLMVVNRVMAPVIAEMVACQRSEELEKILRAAGTAAFLVAFAVVIVFVAVGESVLVLIYGDYYRQAWTVLLILACGQLVNIMTGSCGSLLSMSGHQKSLMYLTLGTGLVTIIASMQAVQVYGILGVAVVAAASLAMCNLATFWLAYKLTGISTFVDFKAVVRIKDSFRLVRKAGGGS